MFELSVLICAHNEAQELEGCLRALQSVMIHESISAEVIIVDSHSDDATVDIATKLSATMPELHMRVLERKTDQSGYGSLVRYGLANASGTYCVLVSADGTDPVTLIPKLLGELRKGCQLAICTRYAGSGSASTVGAKFRIYQQIYRGAIRTLLGEEITDSTNGFRAFDRAFIQALGLSSTKFAVCPEMTFKTNLAGGEIAYIPGQPRERAGVGSEKFKLRNEIAGYALVLTRAVAHRAGVRWF